MCVKLCLCVYLWFLSVMFNLYLESIYSFLQKWVLVLVLQGENVGFFWG